MNNEDAEAFLRLVYHGIVDKNAKTTLSKSIETSIIDGYAVVSFEPPLSKFAQVVLSSILNDNDSMNPNTFLYISPILT